MLKVRARRSLRTTRSHSILETSRFPIAATAGLLVVAFAFPLVSRVHAISSVPAPLTPGDLIVSRSVYQGTAATVAIGQALPGSVPTTFSTGATTTTGTVGSNAGFVVGGPAQITHGGTNFLVTIALATGKTSLTWTPALATAPASGDAIVPLADANGSYPGVWANETPDPSFGVTSPIFLDELTTSGTLVQTVSLPTSGPNQVVTSFSSKSEIGLNLSPDGTSVAFMGYVSPINTLDVSNANTPGHVDPTNPVGLIFQRAVGQIDMGGNILVTPVNTYSGNNGRAAIAANGLYYIVGNAGNGSGTEPFNVVNNTGVQATTPGGSADTTVVGIEKNVCTSPPPANGCQFGFATQDIGLAADKSGKDDNFRGLTIFGNTLYVTKGSGSNGVNTLYQVGTPGSLPTIGAGGTASSTAISIVPGFPMGLARNTTPPLPRFPFGVWFANASTAYVADEGDGTTANAATDAQAGLQKWVLSGGSWMLAYTLQNGLNLGTQYSVPNGPNGEIYPTALNPATDGLRNLAGRVNGDGTVTIYAVTSTVSANTDQGADPNQLVAITDTIAFNTPAQAAGETFGTVKAARYGEVLRGVALAGSAAVTRGGFVRDRRTNAWVQQLTVENTSSNTIPGPLNLVLDNLSATATLSNLTGFVAQNPPLGGPYISLPSTAGGLAPGASVSVALQFGNPTNGPISYTTRVLPGTVVP